MQVNQLIAAITVALALSFAAGSAYSTATADAHAEALIADYISVAPFEYFPGRYVNQATEIEPLPPQF